MDMRCEGAVSLVRHPWLPGVWHEVGVQDVVFICIDPLLRCVVRVSNFVVDGIEYFRCLGANATLRYVVD